MPRSANRRQVEIPSNLYEVLDGIAATQRIPTSALVATWLREALETKSKEKGSPAYGKHVPDLYRGDGPEMYTRKGMGPRGLEQTVAQTTQREPERGELEREVLQRMQEQRERGR